MKDKPLLLLLFFLICCSWVQGIEPMSDAQSLQDWKGFYRRYFGVELNISGIEVPAYQEGYDRIIVVAGGISYQDIIETMKKRFDLLFMNAFLDNFYDHNIISVRRNNETYAVRVRNSIYSGEYSKMSTTVEKLSYSNTRPFSINDMTLMERLIFELKYYDETNGHLDTESFTVCGGSFYKKDSLSLSPAVGWKTGKGFYYPPFLFITECYKAFTLDGLYSRNVITITQKPEKTEPADPPKWYDFPYLPDSHE